MSYWTFTDIFEEAGPRATPLHGGFGLLNYQDLPKPSYFAFKFLNQLGDLELGCSDPAALVCRDQTGAVQALFWDFTITHPGPAVITGRTIPQNRLGLLSCGWPAWPREPTVCSPTRSDIGPTTCRLPGAILVRLRSSRGHRSRHCARPVPERLASTKEPWCGPGPLSPGASICARMMSGSWCFALSEEPDHARVCCRRFPVEPRSSLVCH